jgi:hypothetical protein
VLIAGRSRSEIRPLRDTTSQSRSEAAIERAGIAIVPRRGSRERSRGASAPSYAAAAVATSPGAAMADVYRIA